LGVEKPVVCAEWDLARPAIPSRGRLYSLEPVGIDTPEAESLTSYVSRLAEAHSVRVPDLVMHELLPFLKAYAPGRWSKRKPAHRLLAQ
jgi:hypothetical protein